MAKVDLSQSIREEFESVGLPLQNTSISIRDSYGGPVPVGFEGEIYISGPSVSPRYSNNDALTARNFSLEFTNKQDVEMGWNLCYRSGDKGRLLEDGSLVPLGRIDGDNQIKLRGIRVELEGIEDSLLKSSQGIISEAIVVPRGQSTSHTLVGFVAFSSGQTQDQSDYLYELLERLPLPKYMRPSTLIPVDRIPRTANGKVDRHALKRLALLHQDHQIQESALEPLSDLEERLSNIWKEVLCEHDFGPTEISGNTEFFEIGGNSLLAVALQHGIRSTFGVLIPLRELFQASSLQSMAARIKSDSTDREYTHHTEDWIEDVAIPASFYGVVAPSPSLDVHSPPQRVILTGAFGFLGSNILQELVNDPSVIEIHCVGIRQKHGQQPRISPITSNKIMVHTGDLSLPFLGLSEEMFDRLANNTDAIIHNAAEVSFLKSYRSLRKVNVQSTRDLLRLALPRRIPVHYISTGSVSEISSSFAGPESKPLETNTLPSDLGPPQSSTVSGYSLSKWASERLLENAARELEVPIVIHRPMHIAGDGVPGMDLVGTLLNYSAKTKTVPLLENWHGSFDLNDVHDVAAGIQQAVCGTKKKDSESHDVLKILHYCGQTKFLVGELKGYVERVNGIECKELDLMVWIEESRKHGLVEEMATFLELMVGVEHVIPEMK